MYVLHGGVFRFHWWVDSMVKLWKYSSCAEIHVDDDEAIHAWEFCQSK